MKKRTKKTKMDKFKYFLKRNELIIDFISKIIFGAFSLVLVIIANELVRSQLEIDKNRAAPIFFISKSNDIKKYDNLYKLENQGGKVYYLRVDRFDLFTIQVRDLEINQVITYYNSMDLAHNISYYTSTRLKDSDKDSTWYYAPKQSYISTLQFRDKALTDLEKRYPDEYINIMYPSSYYKITYHDYQNIYNEDYYTDHGEYMSYDKTMSEKGMFSDDTTRYHMYGSILAKYDTEEELYDTFITSLYQEFDRYISYDSH